MGVEQRMSEEVRITLVNNLTPNDYIKVTNDFYKLEKKCIKLNNIIKKAIEYIEENSDDMHTYISQVLTDILKGSE